MKLTINTVSKPSTVNFPAPIITKDYRWNPAWPEIQEKNVGYRKLNNTAVSKHKSSKTMHTRSLGLLCAVFESRGNPGVTRESRVTPGLRENSVFKPSNPGVNSG